MTSTAAPAADGALVIDKPSGPSSHDIVSAVRRALGGVKVGHTGTLDPLATGVLPLLIGRATRLAQFVASATKTYTAHVQFGWSTDTYDSAGEPTGPPAPAAVDRGALETVLGRFRGSFSQRPPAYSAKKVGGHRAYALARASRVVTLEPVIVTVHDLRLLELEAGRATIEVTSSAGFYVRSLAHDLGVALGIPAHLARLRRIRSGEFDLTQAVPFAEALQAPRSALHRLVPAGALLRHLEGCRLSDEGVRWVCHGRDIEPRLLLDAPPRPGTTERPVRLLDAAGELV
ncbi:MAG: tRNA pseudouridine(55) synthase TruB, partial [Aldersonia sp.]|nr:tRNA pseudouridine(55) synthase TruB [Aldersonia sp.]